MRRKVKRGVWRFTALVTLMSTCVWPAAGVEPDGDTNVETVVKGDEARDDTVDDATSETGEQAELANAELANKDDLHDATTKQTGQRRWTDGWVPAFALTGSFQAHNYKSSLESECVQGGPGAEGGSLIVCSQSGPLGRGTPPMVFPLDPPNPLRDPADGSDFTLWPGVGIDLHLMTPTIVELPYKISSRIFINAEVTAQFPPERRIANEGSLESELAAPESLNDPTLYPSQAISGAGSETVSQPKTFQFGAQVGFAFPIEIANRKVRIKPSFGWIHYDLDISGRVLSPLKDDINGSPPPISNWGSQLRTVELSNSTTRAVNGIGPGLEIELESGQFGAIGAAVFMGISAYKVLGDRTIDLEDEVSFPDGTAGGDGLLDDTYRARWHHEIDPWMYRFKVGLRFHYLGKNKI